MTVGGPGGPRAGPGATAPGPSAARALGYQPPPRWPSGRCPGRATRDAYDATESAATQHPQTCAYGCVSLPVPAHVGRHPATFRFGCELLLINYYKLRHVLP